VVNTALVVAELEVAAASLAVAIPKVGKDEVIAASATAVAVRMAAAVGTMPAAGANELNAALAAAKAALLANE
jgi:hypothetical protein